MKLKHFLLTLLVLAFSLPALAKSDKHRGPAWQSTEKNYSINQIRDLALIYQGGSQRIPWTEDQIEPYVVHKFGNGKKNWLFDGFLFLEFADMPECNYAPGYRGKRDARKEDWQRYLDRMFEKGKALDALNSCIETNKVELGDPGFKHKVVITLPTPLPHQKDWGEVNGKKLDFDKVEDAKLACQWYLDQLTDRFANAGFNNLELTGIYWVDEDMWHLDGFTKHISPYIHQLGLQFVWIPYFKAKGFENWRELGFDIVYHQPNHFFHKYIPDSRIDEACSLARQHGMGMEFECDENALFQKENSSYDRMNAYMDGFWRHNVFTDAAIAYYTGGHLMLDFVKNPCPENQAIMDRLASIIVDRRANPSLVPDNKNKKSKK